MTTDRIRITDTSQTRNTILHETERFCQFYAITGKSAMHMRLLAEESFNIVHGIFDGFTGEFWLESTPSENGMLCRIEIAADVIVTDTQEDALRSLSTTGENMAARGVVGMIREIFRFYIQGCGNGLPQQQWEMMSSSGTFCTDAYYGWSLNQYRQNVSQTREHHDELERSIIAKIADEVQLRITTNRAVVTIEKNLPEITGVQK